MGEPCGLSLEGGSSAGQFGGGVGGGARPIMEVVIHRYHDVDFPTEMLDFALARRPYTSFSTLQAK